MNIKKELLKGVVYMARHKEFYGHIIQQFQKVFVEGDHHIKTAAVGRYPGDRFVKLYFNEDFFNGIFEDNEYKQAWKYMLGVIEHEILHIVFGHLFIRFQDTIRGNVATDCVVNSVLPKDVLPGDYCHPDKYGFPTDKSAMWYYTNLRDNDKFQKQLASGAFGPGGQLEHVMGSHGMWEDVKDDLMAKEFSKDIIRKAKDLCKGSYGDVPGRVIDTIDDLLRPKNAIIPWGKVLRLFCASAAESVLDYTVKRKSKRFGTRPGTRLGDVLKLAVAVDTSGSIADWQLVMFWNEINWIRRNGAEVWVFECDTRNSERSPFRYNGKWDGRVHGRGGTDLEPPLKAAEGKFDAIISFTDFCAPKISTRYRIPVLWVLTEEMDREDYPYEWGRRILIDQESGKAVPVPA